MIKIKEANITHAEKLTLLMKEFYAESDRTLDSETVRKAFIDLIHQPVFGRAYLIYKDRDVIGYAVLTIGFSMEFFGRHAYLDDFFIREEFRNEGFGAEALKLIEREACLLKLTHLLLESSTNTRAKNLYFRNGYKMREENHLMVKEL